MAQATTGRKYYKATKDRRGFRKTAHLEPGDRVVNSHGHDLQPGIFLRRKGKYAWIETFDHQTIRVLACNVAYHPPLRVLYKRAKEVREMTPAERIKVGLRVNQPEQWTYADEAYQEAGLPAPRSMQERLTKRASKLRCKLASVLPQVQEASGCDVRGAVEAGSVQGLPVTLVLEGADDEDIAVL